LAANARAGESGDPLLTRAGLRYFLALSFAARQAVTIPAVGATLNGKKKGKTRLPRWDAETRTLWVGDDALKVFRQPAANQTALLAAIEARGWAFGHVSNPLPRERGETEAEVQERLHETIKNLNRGMPPRTIRFRGDGSGHGVWWEYSGGDFLV
jgi:hypothetical protein